MGKPQQTVAAYIVSLWAGLQAIGGVVIGLSILVGGASHFSGPSMTVAHTLFPWFVWGLAYLLISLLHGAAVRARRRSVLATGLALALMHGTLAGSVMVAVAQNDHASATAPGTYAGLMVMTAAGAALARQVFTIEAQLHPDR